MQLYDEWLCYFVAVAWKDYLHPSHNQRKYPNRDFVNSFCVIALPLYKVMVHLMMWSLEKQWNMKAKLWVKRHITWDKFIQGAYNMNLISNFWVEFSYVKLGNLIHYYSRSYSRFDWIKLSKIDITEYSFKCKEPLWFFSFKGLVLSCT